MNKVRSSKYYHTRLKTGCEPRRTYNSNIKTCLFNTNKKMFHLIVIFFQFLDLFSQINHIKNLRSKVKIIVLTWVEINGFQNFFWKSTIVHFTFLAQLWSKFDHQ